MSFSVIAADTFETSIVYTSNGTLVELSITMVSTFNSELDYEYEYNSGFTVFLSGGSYTIQIQLILIELNPTYDELTEIMVDYKIGDEEYVANMYNTHLYDPDTYASHTSQKTCSGQDYSFQMKFSCRLLSTHANTLLYSEWDEFFKIEPLRSSGSNLIYVYIFVPIGVVALIAGITIPTVISRRKRSLQAEDISMPAQKQEILQPSPQEIPQQTQTSQTPQIVYVQQPQQQIDPRMLNSPKSRFGALILSLLFGYLGFHRFYLGKVGTGVLYLLTGGVFGIGWVLDTFIILIGGFRDSEGRRV